MKIKKTLLFVLALGFLSICLVLLAFPAVFNNDAMRKLMDAKAVNIIHYGAMSQEHTRFFGAFGVLVFVVSGLLCFVKVDNFKGVFKHATIKM